MLNSRRKIIKIFGAVTASIIFLPRDVWACMGAGESTPIYIHTPINLLSKFYKGSIEDYLNSLYQDKWAWSVKINFDRHMIYFDRRLVENYRAVPIQVYSNIKINSNKLYCSKIELLYRDRDNKNENILYRLALFNLSESTQPYVSTRIRLTSVVSNVYAVVTYSNIGTNNVEKIVVSSNPLHVQVRICGLLTFEYIDA